MANKRMFNIKIVDSDAFLDMPLSTQALYFHLNMRADDDGFVGNPKRIKSLIGASDDDLKLLIAKRFVLIYDDGVIVIKHWRMHNTIQKDRYTKTAYIEELKKLGIKENKSYTLVNSMETKCIQNVSTDIDIDLDTDKGLDKGKELDKEYIYAPSDLENHSVPLIELPLNDKTLFPIFQTDIEEWQELYEAVDVLNQLKRMKGWLNANPTRRKTRKGIKRFINNWLSQQQDRGFYEQKAKKNEVETSNPFLEMLGDEGHEQN